jgi:hypothetical protein
LLEITQLFGHGDEAVRQSLVRALEELPPPEHPFLSTALIEALQSLGALEEDEADHVDVVRDDIRRLLADQSDPDMQKLAFGVWFSQFDHPYVGAYCKAIYELKPDDLRTLLTMAAQGADDDASFISVLIVELASLNERACGLLIGRWALLPRADCFMPQDAVGVFITAHVALARLGCNQPIPFLKTPLSDAAQALAACATLLFWLNRTDLPIQARRANCEQALGLLTKHELGTAASAIREFYRAPAMSSEGFHRLPGSEPVQISLGDSFPKQVAEICRECLRNPDRQTGYFRYFTRQDLLIFAIDALARWGDVTDLELLRAVSHAADVGPAAIHAIKTLEQSSISPALYSTGCVVKTDNGYHLADG